MSKPRRIPTAKGAMDDPINIQLINDIITSLEYVLSTFNESMGQVVPKDQFLRDGMLAYADGTNWNPGQGKGFYVYNATTSSWNKLLVSTMGGNIILNGNYLSNDGGNEGVSVDNSGNVTVSGTLQTGGNIKLTGKYLSNDGGDEGVSVDNSGNVIVSGTLTPNGNIILGAKYLSGDGGNEGISIDSAGKVTLSGNCDMLSALLQTHTLYVGYGGIISGNTGFGSAVAGYDLQVDFNQTATDSGGLLFYVGNGTTARQKSMYFDLLYNAGVPQLRIVEGANLYFTIDTNAAWFSNNVSALSYTDRTPYYEGDALTALEGIQSKDGKIDHATLPAFAKVDRVVFKQADPSDPNSVDETFISEERDLGAMISMLTVAVVQLNDEINKLKNK